MWLDRVPDKLWMGDSNVQETVAKIILKKKNCKKAKGLSEEALYIDEKRRELKGKGGRERYTYLNAEFHRRDKKAF